MRGYLQSSTSLLLHNKSLKQLAERNEWCITFSTGAAPFADCFVSHILKRNIRIEEDLIDQLFNSTEKRLKVNHSLLGVVLAD